MKSRSWSKEGEKYKTESVKSTERKTKKHQKGTRKRKKLVMKKNIEPLRSDKRRETFEMDWEVKHMMKMQKNKIITILVIEDTADELVSQKRQV